MSIWHWLVLFSAIGLFLLWKRLSRVSGTPPNIEPRIDALAPVAEDEEGVIWSVIEADDSVSEVPARSIRQRMREGSLVPTALVWHVGMTEWHPANEIPGLCPRDDSLPAALNHYSSAPCITISPDKSLVRDYISVNSGKSNGIIASHWRGELPLGVSYWTLGFFGNIFVTLLIITIAQLFSGTPFNPIATLSELSLIWIIIVSFTIWQVVGCWRSANKYINERQKSNQKAPWAGLAKLGIIIGCLQSISSFVQSGGPQLSELYNMAFFDDPSMPPYKITLESDGKTIDVNGGFKFGLSDDFSRLIGASPNVTFVKLDSPGGRVGEAHKLSLIIQERQLITYVSGFCASACTIAFAAGRQRWLQNGAVLGFHAASFPGISSSELEAGMSVQRQSFVQAGIQTWFIDKALSTPSSQLWRPTYSDLNRANVITGVLGVPANPPP